MIKTESLIDEKDGAMNINQIKYVLMVAKSSSMREAAGRLYISQPALSAAIRELEDELGILIFERSNKGITLTEAGQEFITYAKKTINQYEILEDKYLSKDKNKERFSVSTQHYNFAIRSFTNVIKRFDPEKYTFAIHETRTYEVLENVRNLKSEIGIISYSGDNEKIIKKLFKEYQLDFVPLMKKDTYVYVWENHKLANRKQVSLDELKEYPCVSFDQNDDSDFYLQEEAMGNYEFDKLIKSADRATTLEIIAELGGYSIGVGMLAKEDATLKGLVSIKLVEDDPLTIGYIKRKGSHLSVYGQAYIEELLKYKEI